MVTPLGHGAWETFRALLNGKTIADRASALPHDIHPVDLLRTLGSVPTAQHAHADPAIDLAERAAREAMTTAGAHPDQLRCIVAVSKGAMHALTQAAQRYGSSNFADAAPRPRNPSDLAQVLALGPMTYFANHLQQRLGVPVVRQVIAACASGLTGLHDARNLLNSPQPSVPVSKLLVVTAEASLLPLFIHSYRRLGVLPPLTRDGYRGRPLDRRRNGFMLAEVGAAVVLEATETILPGQIELVDTAVGSEAHDLIRPAPGLPALDRVAQKLLKNREIDLLHPHATGTVENDAAELNVYSRCLGHSTVDVYAHKGAIGHGLGASGLVSLVIACLCARTDIRPPMPWLHEPLPPKEPGLQILKEPRSPTGPIHHQAIFAAGFGGHVAGAVIRRHVSSQ